MWIRLCALAALGISLLPPPAGAEEDPGYAMVGGLEAGQYVARIPCAGEEAEFFSAEVQEGGAASLAFSGFEDGAYTARFAPVSDGSAAASILRRDSGGAVREMYTFDLRVRDGQMEEPAGGSYTAAPADEELDPYLSGEWLQAETQWDSLFLTLSPEGGWDAEIFSPVTHAAAVFTGRFRYDCLEESLVCLDGKLYEAPITDEETEAGLGKPIAEGLRGVLRFDVSESGDEGALCLIAYTRMHDEPVTFVRAKTGE